MRSNTCNTKSKTKMLMQVRLDHPIFLSNLDIAVIRVLAQNNNATILDVARTLTTEDVQNIRMHQARDEGLHGIIKLLRSEGYLEFANSDDKDQQAQPSKERAGVLEPLRNTTKLSLTIKGHRAYVYHG